MGMSWGTRVGDQGGGGKIEVGEAEVVRKLTEMTGKEVGRWMEKRRTGEIWRSPQLIVVKKQTHKNNYKHYLSSLQSVYTTQLYTENCQLGKIEELYTQRGVY